AGAAALSADNAWVIALTTVMLPMIVNGTFYLELALGQTIAWVDAQLTLRWESIVYLVSAALALGWLAVVHATIPTETRGLLAGVLAVATGGSLRVLRLGDARAAVPRGPARRTLECPALRPDDVPAV